MSDDEITEEDRKEEQRKLKSEMASKWAAEEKRRERAPLAKYRDAARRRDLEFSLTEAEFLKLVISSCFYCGLPYEHSPSGFNGVDRVDNAKGYLADNVVPCCKWCNHAKHTMSQAEFFSWIERVYFHLAGKGFVGDS